MTSSAAWLTAIALAYLVLINAVANGCRLALRDVEPAIADVAEWPSNLGRALAAAGGASAAAVQLRSRDHGAVEPRIADARHREQELSDQKARRVHRLPV